MDTIKWPAGLKRTRQRELVFRVLSEAEKPLDAKEIYRRMLPEDGTLAVSTVYRVLTALEEKGLVSKTTMMGEETALYSLRSSDHAHYAICLQCHRQFPLKHCPLEQLPIEDEADDFTITDHRLELYGYCKDCLRKK